MGRLVHTGLSVADSHPNPGSDSSSAFAWTYGWRFGTKHSRTARRPASLAAMSAGPCAAGNAVGSSPTALAPMRISLRSPAQAPASQSIPCAAARGPRYRGSASLFPCAGGGAFSPWEIDPFFPVLQLHVWGGLWTLPNPEIVDTSPF